ncbi:MAG: penicillin-binding protein 2 [Candidatus Margulisbacteria bacterium]|nr:penicillin-binding protein 2 [Candidatus Margulisiibacteriota bacterium]
MQLQKIINISPSRGRIFDRNGTPLALSKTALSAYAIPPQIQNKWEFAAAIAPILKLPSKTILKKISVERPFVWLKRKLDTPDSHKLQALKLSGLSFIEEEKRVYPHEDLACSVLGFVGIDNQGLSGLEYQFNQFLTGSSGKMILDGDPMGFRIITGSRTVKLTSYNGGDIFTSIDEYIQFITQQFLEEGIQKMKAKSGQAIVMNPKTGDILGMASYPYFNPNMYWKYPPSYWKNKCVTDVFEPGSISKVFTIAGALEENIFKSSSTIKVPETLQIANHTISEAHKRKEGESEYKTVQEILKESLNVGSSLIAIELGKHKLYKYLTAFGFGKTTPIDLPGEVAGLLRPPHLWSGVDIAMMSFGQGFAVTSLQLALALCTIANDGEMVKPRIIRELQEPRTKSIIGQGLDMSIQYRPKLSKGHIISRETAKDITHIMVSVTEEGTGFRAKVPPFKVAGKTATAQKAGAGGIGYLKDTYIASFGGFLPANNPEILILVTVDTPTESIWGSTVAAPIFQRIAKACVDYLNILPPPTLPVLDTLAI